MKVIRKIALWAVAIFYILLVLGFVSKKYEEQLCNSLEVNILDSVNTAFLIPADIEELLSKNNVEYLGKALHKIDIDLVEKVILSNQIVKTCDVYTTLDGVLHVDLTQRHPYVRIMDARGQGYYFDREGNVLTLSKRFSPHVLVVNGHIRPEIKPGDPVNVHKLGDKKWEQKLKEIYKLSSFIAEHEFWNAQIVQVYLTKSGEYELVPRVGPHIIILGGIDDYQKKFKKLEVFYNEGLNRVGWNQYVKINLKYKDQVVCTKI